MFNLAGLKSNSLTRRLLSGGAWVFGVKILTVIIGLMSSGLLARSMTPFDFGIYLSAYSIVTVVATFSSLGLRGAIVRFIAELLGTGRETAARDVLVRSMGFVSICAFSGCAMFLFFGKSLNRHLLNEPALVSVIGLSAGWIFITVFQSFFTEVFRGFHDLRFASIFGASFNNGLVTGFLLVVGLSTMNLLAFDLTLKRVMILSLAAGSCSVLVAGWLILKKIRTLPLSREVVPTVSTQDIFRLALPLWVTSTLTLFLGQSSVWILTALTTPEDVAIYGAASRLMLLVSMPIFVANAVVPPIIAELHAQGKKESLENVLRATATLTGLPAAVAFLFLVIFSEQTMRVIYGSYYTDAAIILIILSVGQIINVFSGSCGIVLSMTGHQNSAAIISTITGIIIITVSILVTPFYGVLGVTIVYSLGLALQNLIKLVWVKLRVGIWTHMSFSPKHFNKAWKAITRR